jgi:hypothetical protein
MYAEKIAGQQLCGGFGSKTKYCCITCNIYVCNRPLCRVAEENENAEGWMENSVVASFLSQNKIQ